MYRLDKVAPLVVDRTNGNSTINTDKHTFKGSSIKKTVHNSPQRAWKFIIKTTFKTEIENILEPLDHN